MTYTTTTYTCCLLVTGRDGSICIRNSENIVVSHLIGPAMEESQLRARRDIISNESWIAYDLAKYSSKDQGHYCKMTGVSPRNTFAVYYELQKDIVQHDEIFLQVVVKWTSNNGQRCGIPFQFFFLIKIINFPWETTLDVV